MNHSCKTVETPPKEFGEMWIVRHECRCEHGHLRAAEIRVESEIMPRARRDITNMNLHRIAVAAARCEDDHPELVGTA